jgi:deazaflavin-dependent oxidoreductase (nitroreductase family)
MKIPEPLFAIINVVVRALLKSPLHGLASNSLLLIHYTGRKSGKSYCTPVRYSIAGDKLRCLTSAEIQWWRNVQACPNVSLVVRGKRRSYVARVTVNNPERIQGMLVSFLAQYPQDAAYQDIRLNADGSLNAGDLARASLHAVVVDFEKVIATS